MSQHIDAVAKQSGLDALNSNKANKSELLKRITVTLENIDITHKDNEMYYKEYAGVDIGLAGTNTIVAANFNNFFDINEWVYPCNHAHGIAFVSTVSKTVTRAIDVFYY